MVTSLVPELLTWIQDMNWPVAGPVSDYLKSLSEFLTDDIIKILSGNDDVWKYWGVSVFGLNTTKPIDPKLMTEFNRISTNPTRKEVYKEIHELTLEFIKVK